MVCIKAGNANRYREIGLKIGYYRKLRGLTQEQLAEKVNMELSSIGALEAPNVERTISLEAVFAIADVLETPPYKFLQFEDDC